MFIIRWILVYMVETIWLDCVPDGYLQIMDLLSSLNVIHYRFDCHLVFPKVCQSKRVEDSCCCFTIAMCLKTICIVHALSLYLNDTPSAVWYIHAHRSNTVHIAMYVFDDDCVIDKEERMGHAFLMSGMIVVINVPAQQCWCQTVGLYPLLLLCTSGTMLLLDAIIRLCW